MFGQLLEALVRRTIAVGRAGLPIHLDPGKGDFFWKQGPSCGIQPREDVDHGVVVLVEIKRGSEGKYFQIVDVRRFQFGKLVQQCFDDLAVGISFGEAVFSKNPVHGDIEFARLTDMRNHRLFPEFSQGDNGFPMPERMQWRALLRGSAR